MPLIETGVPRNLRNIVGAGGLGTHLYFFVNYSPPGASDIPAMSISHTPGSDTDTESPSFLISSGVHGLGPTFMLARHSDGNLVDLRNLGITVLFVDHEGTIDNEKHIKAGGSITGGVTTIPVGNQAIDMEAGNYFESTPDQNAVWTTTTGREGQIALFSVDNSGGHTITFSTGFTSVRAIGGTGLSERLVYNDGSTWRELRLGGNGVARGVLYNWDFKMVDINNYATPLTGLAVSVTISKDGSAFVALTGSPAVSEIGYGWYTVAVPAVDTNYTRIVLRATATGAGQTDRGIITE